MGVQHNTTQHNTTQHNTTQYNTTHNTPHNMKRSGALGFTAEASYPTQKNKGYCATGVFVAMHHCAQAQSFWATDVYNIAPDAQQQHFDGAQKPCTMSSGALLPLLPLPLLLLLLLRRVLPLSLLSSMSLAPYLTPDGPRFPDELLNALVARDHCEYNALQPHAFHVFLNVLDLAHENVKHIKKVTHRNQEHELRKKCARHFMINVC